MKKIFKYYLFIERPIMIVTAAVCTFTLMAILLTIFALTANSIYEMGGSVYEYFTLRGSQIELCESLSENNPDVYWKDETFLGFGPNGSYGCFMKDPEVEK